ncbi:MAG: permease, partial [Desulfovibrio sp.]|nr:permease [Desulfovibrio sp.]
LMREIGILLFMACVGLYAGTGFVDTVVNGPGLRWMGIGAIITFVPLFTAALFCRAVWKINFPTICGMLAGSMTDPPALAFAMQYYGGEVAATGYSTVYPVTMILRILMGQLLVLLLIS